MTQEVGIWANSTALGVTVFGIDQTAHSAPSRWAVSDLQKTFDACLFGHGIVDLEQLTTIRAVQHVIGSGHEEGFSIRRDR